MLVREYSKKATRKVPEEQSKEMIKKMRKEHEKPVKGMFEFIDAQGGWLEFTVRFFPGDPVTYIKLNHGEVCELPLGIVKHLNNTKKKVRKASIEAGQNGQLHEYEVVSRIRFTPMDVM